MLIRIFSHKLVASLIYYSILLPFYEAVSVFDSGDDLFSFETGSAAGGIVEMPEGHWPD